MAGVQLIYLISVVLAAFHVTESDLLERTVDIEAFVCLLMTRVTKTRLKVEHQRVDRPMVMHLHPLSQVSLVIDPKATLDGTVCTSD